MRLSIIAAGLVSLLCAGNSHAVDTKDYEGLVKEMLSTLNKLGDTLATATDKATAEKAKTEVKKIADKMKELKEKADKLGKPTAEQEKEIMEKYSKELRTATEKMTKEAIRLAATDYGMDLLKELQSIK